MQAKRSAPHIGVVERAEGCGLNIPWYRLLAMGIVVRAWLDQRALKQRAEDSMYNCGVWVSEYELDRFFGSKWCDLLLTGTEHTGENIKEAAICAT